MDFPARVRSLESPEGCMIFEMPKSSTLVVMYSPSAEVQRKILCGLRSR